MPEDRHLKWGGGLPKEQAEAAPPARGAKPAHAGNWAQSRNPGQEAAIRHGSGPLLVISGPGSGKTYVIMQRLRCLIEERKVDPASILVITFTRAAAEEMKSRFSRLMEGKNYPVCFGTFHAIFFHILKNAYHYHSGNILSEYEKRELLKTILLRPSFELSAEEETVEQLLSRISRYKNGGPAEEEGALPDGQTFLRLYEAYQAEAVLRKKLDFDDILLQCGALLREYPKIRDYWQKKFQYIMVDEFQDINAVQYDVLRILALPENNLFAVGDDDQSIYSFRGARPRIMLDFQRDYPQAGRVELSQNYRCTPEILQKAVCLIGANRERFPKKLRAMKPSGPPVRFLGFPSQEEQNLALVRELEQAGEDRKKTAVIYRTNHDAARLAELLADRKIPFQLREKLKSPYQSPAVLDLRAYLSFVHMGRRRLDFYRIMNKPKRYLSRNAVPCGVVDFDRLRGYYREKPYMQEGLRKLQMDVGRLEKMDLYAAVNYIRKGVGYEDYLKRYAIDNGKDWQELAGQLDWFQQQMRSFSAYMELEEAIRSYERELRKASSSQVSRDAVSLLTMHASKGLEFDVVYIPDCNEGVIPHKKSGRGEQVEEERRMLYVAMTRAKRELTISWVAGSEEEPGFLSRFLNDMGL